MAELDFDDLIPQADGGLSFDDLIPGAAKPTAADPFEGEGFGSLARRRGQQVVEGAADAVGSLPEAAAITGAAVDATETEEAARVRKEREETIRGMRETLAQPDLNPKTREFIERNLADMMVGQEELQTRADAEVVPAQDRPGFKRGEAVRKAATDAVGAPDPRDTSIWADVAKGGGQVGAQILMAAPAALAGPAGAIAIGGVAAAGAGQAQIYNEAIQSGADEEMAQTAARWGALIGATEVVPVARALKIVPPRLRSKFEEGVLRRVGDIFQAAGEEGAQEALSQLAQNYVAQQTFDPDRVLTDGVARGALVGGILGGSIGAVGTTVDAALDPGPDRMRTESPRLTQADRNSPIPNDVIDDGKAAIDNLLSGRATPAAPVAGGPDVAATRPAAPVMPAAPGAITQPAATDPGAAPEVAPPDAAPVRPDAPAAPGATPVDAAPVRPADPVMPEAPGAVTQPAASSPDAAARVVLSDDPAVSAATPAAPGQPAVPGNPDVATQPTDPEGDRFEEIPEVETVNGEEVETGRVVVLDRQTGKVRIREDGQPAPAQGPMPMQGPTPAAADAAFDLDSILVEGEPETAPTAAADDAASTETPPTQEQTAPTDEGQTPARPPIRARAVRSDVAVTPAGRDVDVEYAVVEADDLTPSNLDDGRVNPAFPVERQPRDRSRGASVAQVSGIANKLDPRLLDTNASTTDGAPIVDASGIVESGNGRVMAIRQAYGNVPASADKYRSYLAEKGYPVAGMKAPVLVRIRKSEMTGDEVSSFTRESNERTTAAMSSTERAMSDAQALPDSAMGLYRGGDIDSTANRDFVRAVMQSVVSESDRGQMIDRQGSMSQDAVRRVQNVLLAKAYGKPDLVAKLSEAGDSNMKAIGGALTDIAPAWSKMRAAARDGGMAAEMDGTDALLEAVAVVDRARSSGRNIAEFTSQPDLLTGEGLSDNGRAFLALMFRNTQQWTNPVGRPKMVEALQFYTDQAMESQPGASMFGDRADPLATVTAARSRVDGKVQEQAGIFAAPVRDPGARAREAGTGGTGPTLPAGQNDGSAAGASAREPEGEGEVAPATGRKSKEQRQPDARTDTPEFRRWFGDSKVVDENGNPLVVYHGTRADIEAFDLGKVGLNTDSGWMGEGFYFGDQTTASNYAGWDEMEGRTQDGGNVMPVYLSLKNPAILKDTARNDGPRTMVREVLDYDDAATSKEVRDGLIAAGYDGVIYERFSPYGQGYREYLAFRPEQIKSAFNRGTYDPTDARISYQKQPMAGGKASDLSTKIPALRQRLDDMGLGRVRLDFDGGLQSQGRFDVSATGDMGILIGASLDPDNTLSHEAIHALRAMNLFTDTEWRDLSRVAESEWLDRYDIEDRYSDLSRDEQIEEAIAEAFADYRPGTDGTGSGLVGTAFAKLRRFMEGVRAWLNGNGVTRPEDMFGDVLSGRVGARDRAGQDTARARAAQAPLADLDAPLVVIHNLSAEKLRHAVDLGGLAAPSLAVARADIGFDAFGEISLIGSPAMADRYGKAIGDKFFESESGRKRAYTLANVVREMTREIRGGEGWNYGAGSARAMVTPEFKTLAQVKAAREKIVEEDAAGAFKDEASAALSALADKFAPYHDSGQDFGWYDIFGEFLKDLSKGKLREWQTGIFSKPVPDSLVAEARSFLDYLRDLPTEYFEIKMQRDVQLHEFDMALVPDKVSASTRKTLEENGLEVVTYADGERRQAVQSLPRKIKFQRQSLTIDDRQNPRRAIRRPVQPPTTLGGGAFIPDRRVWEEISDTTATAWERIGGAFGASSDRLDRARVLLQDYFLPVMRAQQAIEKATGTTLPDGLDAYGKETTFAGKAGRHLFEIDEEFSKPIVELIAETKGGLTVESVGEWLTAKHAAERNAHIATINPAMPDGGSGMTSADAARILRAAAAGPHARKLDTISRLIADLRERTIALREDAGLLSPQEAAMWRGQYQHYVPLQGFADVELADERIGGTGAGGRGLGAQKTEAKRALGRSSKSMNPLVMSIVQAQEASIRAEKNRIAQSLVNLAEAYPSDVMWSVRKPKMKRVFNKTTGLVESRMQSPVQGPPPDNEIAVKVAGKEVRLTLHDPRLAKAIAGMGAEQVGSAVNMIRPFMRYMSMILTTLNPEFLVVNATRDFMAAQINIRQMGGTEKNAIAKGMVKHWPRAFKAAMRGQANKAGTSAQQQRWDAYYAEFEKAGGKVNFFKIGDGLDTGVDLQERVNLKGGTALQRGYKWVKPSERDNPILATIERVNLSTDNAVRLSAYVAARDAGWSQQRAAKLSKDMTVNFNRRGDWGAGLNTLFLFFNAAVQGTQVMFKVFSNPKMATKYGGGLIAAGLVLDMLNSAISDEDEDGELAYDKIPDWRNRITATMMIPNALTPGDTSYAGSFWLPYGYSTLPYIGQQIGKIARGVKDPGDAMADVVAAAFTSFSPINGQDFASAITPTILHPSMELWLNRDRLGRPIMPESPYGDYGPDAYKFYGGVTKASRTISDALNRGTGGTTEESGLLDISPETLDHLAGTFTGGLGTFTGNTLDGIVKTATGQADEINPSKIPFARKLFTTTGSWQDRERFYRFREEVREAQAQAKGYSDDGRAVPPNVANLARLSGLLREVESELRPIRKTRKLMIEAGRPARATKDERKRMDGIEARAMIAFNKAYLAAAGPQAE